jgi:hypothetical protein
MKAFPIPSFHLSTVRANIVSIRHPWLGRLPIVAIVRRPKVDPVRCIEHLFEHDIRLIEITMDTSGAVEVLEYLRSRVPENCLLGAGTVTALGAFCVSTFGDYHGLPDRVGLKAFMEGSLIPGR